MERFWLGAKKKKNVTCVHFEKREEDCNDELPCDRQEEKEEQMNQISFRIYNRFSVLESHFGLFIA